MQGVSKAKIKLNSKGVQELLRSDGVRDDLRSRVSAAAAKLPGAWGVEVTYTDRAGAILKPRSDTAKEFSNERPGAVVAALAEGASGG